MECKITPEEMFELEENPIVTEQEEIDYQKGRTAMFAEQPIPRECRRNFKRAIIKKMNYHTKQLEKLSLDKKKEIEDITIQIEQVAQLTQT